MDSSLVLGGGAVFWAVVLGALAVVAGVAVYAIWVRTRAANGGGPSMQMTPAMAVAGVADGQPGAYAPAAGFSASSESSWAPVAPSMRAGEPVPQADLAFGAEPAQQFAPTSASAPAPEFEFIPAPASAPAPAPQQAPAAVPAPPQIITAGGRIQVHCPACGAGNAVVNRTCILCGKKLPPVS